MNKQDSALDEKQTARESIQWALWKQLWGYSRAHPRVLILLSICAVITAAMEVCFPLITRAVIDTIEQGGDTHELWQYAYLYAGATIIVVLSIGGFIRVGGLLQSLISHDIRRDGFTRLQELSFSYYNHRPVGWLMARMTADCDRLSAILVWGFLDAVWGISMMLGISVAMIWLNPLLAFVVLTVLPVLAMASVYFQRRLLNSARAATAINSRVTASYNEAITGVLTSKVFVREHENSKEFGQLVELLADAKVRNLTYASIYLPVVVSLASLAIGITLVLGGFTVLDGVISVGTLIAFMRFATQLFEPVQQISTRFAELQMAQASAERILGLINTQSTIKDKDLLKTPSSSVIQGISLKNVCFAYDEQQQGAAILNGINLEANYGQSIAIVGPTGGGKSTLVNVIARFYEPTDGAVLIDGVEYRDLGLHWLQSRLGVILQDNHIFNGTLMSNIRYGALDATDEEIVKASKLAGAHTFIVALPDGYQSEAGERGDRLSAGQKQLISFARAIVSDPQILIMDEATSSIDSETEQQIQQGLGSMLKGRIAFIIAHRLSTIRQADRIIFLDSGRIVEQGTHTELIALKGRYRDLYRTQQTSLNYS